MLTWVACKGHFEECYYDYDALLEGKDGSVTVHFQLPSGPVK